MRRPERAIMIPSAGPGRAVARQGSTAEDHPMAAVPISDNAAALQYRNA
jgi:hypothetical protein